MSYTGGDTYKPFATGKYSVAPHLWDATKWAVYSPNGVCVGRYDKRGDAVTEADRLQREQPVNSDLKGESLTP